MCQGERVACFQLAASSPSTRKVRHLALPPDLMNSEKPSSARRSPVRARSSASLGAPSFKITVLPTTTALQLNETASSMATSIRCGNPVAQHRAAVFVERAGIVQRQVGRQRAEARIEVIETRVDQLERQDLDAQPLADPLVAAHIAAKAVAGDQRLAAKERVAGPFEVVSRSAARRPGTPAPRPAFKIAALRLAARRTGTANR